MPRSNPYGNYNYTVDLMGGPRGPSAPLGGFSDVSGLNMEIHVSEYRDGSDTEPHVRKIPGAHKVGDVTLKRGVVDSSDLWAWINQTAQNGYLAQRDVTITLCDEASNPVQSWKLRNVVPMKYTGPTLAGKGGGDVAMEELVLSAEHFEINPAS